MKCHLCGNYGCVESDLRIQGYVEKYRLYAGKELKSYGEFLNLIKKRIRGRESTDREWRNFRPAAFDFK